MQGFCFYAKQLDFLVDFLEGDPLCQDIIIFITCPARFVNEWKITMEQLLHEARMIESAKKARRACLLVLLEPCGTSQILQIGIL